MRKIDELRPLTAGQLLELWRETREAAEDPLERTVLCNARIAAACCFAGGEPVFEDEGSVLAALTGRQLERLLRQLSEAESDREGTGTPSFDQRRFEALREG